MRNTAYTVRPDGSVVPCICADDAMGHINLGGKAVPFHRRRRPEVRNGVITEGVLKVVVLNQKAVEQSRLHTVASSRGEQRRASLVFLEGFPGFRRVTGTVHVAGSGTHTLVEMHEGSTLVVNSGGTRHALSLPALEEGLKVQTFPDLMERVPAPVHA